MLSRFELRRFRGLLPKLALIFAALVPVFYGAIYLAANWDPQGRMRDLPVAVVNLDRPTDFEGKHLQAGQDFTEKVIAERAFDWHQVSPEEADRGLREGDYYLTVTVPADFSRNLVSGAGQDPKRAEIHLERNDANGFVIGSLVGRAEDKIKEQVNEVAVESYFRAVFGNLDEIRTGMVRARDGSVQLRDGLGQAKDGSQKLSDGSLNAAQAGHKLADGATALDKGLGELSTGAGKLSDGMTTLSTKSLELANGADKVAEGTRTLTTGASAALDTVNRALPQVKSDAEAVNTDVQAAGTSLTGDAQSVDAKLSEVDAALTLLATADPTIADRQAYKDAKQKVSDAQTRTQRAQQAVSRVETKSATLNSRVQSLDSAGQISELSSKLKLLDDGAHQVATGADKLHAGIDQAAKGAGDLEAGAEKAKGGSAQLATGAGQLAVGLDSLHDGASQLNDGNQKLLDGATQLAQGLNDGVDRLPAFTKQQTDTAVSVLAAPADVRAEILNPAGVYGRGLAPLFFSIACWVFGISGFLVMRPISGRLLAGRLHPFRLMLSAWLPFGTVAVIGASLMLAAVWILLGLDPVHGVATVALTVLVASVFSLIAHLLRMALNLPGSAIMLVWLILQLSSTGGTYPKEVLPPFFQWLNPFMPITYSIDAYRVVISGGQFDHLVRDVLVLGAVGVGAVLLDVTAVALRQRFRMTDLHPPLQH